MSRSHLCGAAGIGMLAAVLLSGCASGQMSRIDQNRDIYETWPIETRQAVLDGKVEPGMTPDMVKVAWGTPTEVVTNPGGGPGDEVWVYRKGGEDPGAMGYPGGPSYPAGGGYPGGGYPSSYPGGMGSGGTIGVSTGRGGTGIITGGSTGIGIGGSMGGIGIGGGGGGMGGPMMSRPNPADVKEVVFRNGVVYRADQPTETK